MYNFDKIVSREHTSNVKYDLRKQYFGQADVLPMWVADMDFETPDFICKAIQKRAAHPIYGYSYRNDDYVNSIISWQKRRFNWEIEKEWLLFCPGVVPALNYAVMAFTSPGDKVIVQPPVYFPFFSAINNHGRVQLDNQLVYSEGRYTIDFDDLAIKAKEAKMMFFCSPHNPVGRCWTKEEITRLAEICVENDVILVSDEIHNDLILPEFKHTTTAVISEDIAQRTVTFIAPSKTFNIAGLATSSVIISNEALRKKFEDTLKLVHVSGGNLFGSVASQAGYQHGDQWLKELLVYVKKNFDFLESSLKEFKTLGYIPAEATYLAWIDFRKTGMSDDEIKRKLIFEAGLGLSPGPVFGKGGEGFQRMNLAAPRILVEEAVKKLHTVFE